MDTNIRNSAKKTVKETIMTKYKLKGNDLYNSYSHRIATIKGANIYDEHHHRVATINGSNIYDEHHRRVATINGSNIYDEHSHKIASLNDVRKAIDGAIGGASIAGLWLFFVR